MITKVKTVIYISDPYQPDYGSDKFDDIVNSNIKLLENQGLDVTDVKYSMQSVYDPRSCVLSIVYTALLVYTR